jgi:hypothetical protein
VRGLCQAAENTLLFAAANPWPPKITVAAENGAQCCCVANQLLALVHSNTPLFSYTICLMQSLEWLIKYVS